jgi:hypothetical protein
MFAIASCVQNVNNSLYVCGRKVVASSVPIGIFILPHIKEHELVMCCNIVCTKC